MTTQPLSPIPGHERPTGLDDATVDALGKLSEALEVVEHARGLLYGFHRMSGMADFALGDAVDMLRDAGHVELADEIEADLVGRNVLHGRWTFQIVEEYDDGYYERFKTHERQAASSSPAACATSTRPRSRPCASHPAARAMNRCPGPTSDSGARVELRRRGGRAAATQRQRQ